MIPVKGLLDRAKKYNVAKEGDYIQDGLLFCGMCHSKKECFINILEVKHLVPCSCNCCREAWEKREEEEKRKQRDIRVRQLKSAGIADSRYFSYHFDNDDEKLPQISKICKNYVKNFKEIRKNLGGLLFYGNIGTGKTFYACCIANGLMEQGYPVIVTNFSKIMVELQDFEKKKYVIPKLCRQALVVIDDLGTERNTSFGKEQVFSVVDSLLRSEVCTIMTSNLSPSDMKSTTNLEDSRIYDRILGGLCPEQVLIAGKSRRLEDGAVRKRNMQSLLWD